MKNFEKVEIIEFLRIMAINDPSLTEDVSDALTQVMGRISIWQNLGIFLGGNKHHSNKKRGSSNLV